MASSLPAPPGMWRDFQYAARLLRRSPGFTTVALLTLALGIGANTAMFSVLDAVLLRPPAYPDPNRLVVLQRYYPEQQKLAEQISAPAWKDFTERSRTLESVAVYANDTAALTGGGEPEEVSLTAISSNLTAVLRVSPVLGRAFEPSDMQPGSPLTAVIGEDFWRRHFAANPSALGRTLTLYGVPVRIVGVMPASFAFPDRSRSLWLPLRITAQQYQRRNVFFLRTVGRLRRGVSLGAARGDLNSVAAEASREQPGGVGPGVAVMSLQEYLSGNSRTMLQVLAGAVAFVLLIVCTNLAGLLLSRASARTSEFAVRTSLGASRPQLLRLLLAEGLVLSVVGGVVGILLAGWGVEFIRGLAMQQFSRAGDIRIDSGVLLFAVCASLLCGIAFGLAPAWIATRDALARPVRTVRVGTSLRGLLVTAEVAMAFVLLAGAGLLMQSLWKLWHVDAGFSKDQVLTLKIAPRLSRFRTVGQVAAFYENLLAQIRAIPGVRAAGAVGNVPLSGERSGTGISVENRPAAPGESLEANYQLAGPGYFSAMGIPLLAGRDFNGADVKGAPEVVIINRALAELCWPGQDAIGRHLRLGPNAKDPWATVVGVIGNVKHDQLALPPRPEAYENYFQHSWGGMNLAVRRDPQAANVPAAIRAVIRLADPDIPIPAALSMDEVVATSLRDRRFLMWMLAAFAGCAMLLAAIGIYGVIAYAVEQRTREIGIRVALGADRPEVTRLVLSGGMRMAAAGIAIGGAAALGLTRVLGTMLFEVKPGDPVTLAAAGLVLIAVAILACLIPARRATRVEAAVALRHQ